MIDSGIYQIQSAFKPWRCYVGSAKNISKRWKEHLYRLRKGNHHSRHLQRHYNKYGESDLQFSVLERCTVEMLLEIETKHISSTSPYFNGNRISATQEGFKHSDESRKKISLAKKGNKFWVGKKHTDESKAKMRVAKLGRKFSEETRRRLSLAKIGNTNASGNLGNKRGPMPAEIRKKVSDGVSRYFHNKRTQ